MTQGKTISCDEVLRSCAQAVSSLESANKEKDLLIHNLDDYSHKLEVQVSDLKEAQNAWYHNPFVMGALGLVAGTITGIWAAKH